MTKIDNVTIINLTAHQLDLADAAPGTLAERRVDISVPVYQTLNGKFEDKNIVENGFTFAKRQFVLQDKDITEILNSLPASLQQESALLVVSLPVLLNYKARIEALAKVKGFANLKAVGIITATHRTIKPPVACLRYWSI